MKIAVIGFDGHRVSSIAQQLSDTRKIPIVADPMHNNIQSLLELDYNKYFYAYHFQEMMDRYHELQNVDSYILLDSYLHDEGAMEVAYKNHLITDEEHLHFQDKCKEFTNILSDCDVIYHVKPYVIQSLFQQQANMYHLPLKYFSDCYELYRYKVEHLKTTFPGTWIDVDDDLPADATDCAIKETEEVDSTISKNNEPTETKTNANQTFRQMAKQYFEEYLPDVILVSAERLPTLLKLFQNDKDLTSTQYAAINDNYISCLKVIDDETIKCEEYFDLDKVRSYFEHEYD